VGGEVKGGVKLYTLGRSGRSFFSGESKVHTEKRPWGEDKDLFYNANWKGNGKEKRIWGGGEAFVERTAKKTGDDPFIGQGDRRTRNKTR